MIEQIAHLWMAGKAHVTALGTQAAELPARARNALPAREEITGYWQQAIQVRQGIALPLELLHDNVQLSLTVKELREALLDSIIKPSSTALSKRKKEEQAAKAGEKPKAIDGTIDSATTLDQHEESKKEIQENIHYAVRTISNALETHTWSRHITAAFLVSVNEDGFFVEAADDSFQVLQIKKLLNVLYHFELGLESIESEDLKPVLQYLVDLPDNLDERTWKDLLTSDLWNIGKYLLIAADRSAWWQLRSFRNTAADNAKRRVLDAVDHIYSACDLLTHIEPEFFGAFGAEWGWVKDKLASTGVMKQIEPIKDVIAEQSKVDLFKKDLFKKGAFLQGVLLDQLRPNETGGADYSLLFQLLTVFGQEANKKAGKLGRAFLDSDTDAELESKDLLAKLKSWVVEHVAEAKTVKEFEDLVTKEIDERPEEEKQRLKELNRTATRLSRAFARVNGENVFISLDVMHYASIAWYGLNLLSAITKEAKSLNEDSQKAIQKVIIAFRDEYVAQLVGLVDKAEEVSLSTPGALTKPLIAQLEGYYQQMVKNSTFVDLSDLGGLQSEKFTAKRLEMAQKRRAEHVEQLHHVGDVLLQALATLTNPNPSELEKEKMISLYAVLQPHIEAIDMLFSKELIENLQNHSVQYPVISPNNHALLSPLSARLKHLKHTKELAVALTDDLIHESIRPVPAHFVSTKKTTVISTNTILSRRRYAVYLTTLPISMPMDLKPPSDRELDNYVIADKSPIKELAASLEKRRSGLEALIDSEASEEQLLSLKHVTSTLQHLKESCETLGELSNKKSTPLSPAFEESIRLGYDLDPKKGQYVLDTFTLFNDWGQAAILMQPYMVAAHTASQDVQEKAKKAYQEKMKHYQMPASDQMFDLAYSFMHVLWIGTAHFKALSKGQSELPEEIKINAHQKASSFAAEVAVLHQHASFKWTFVSYMVLAYDATRILFKRLMSQETVDKQLVHAVGECTSTGYETMMEHGLDGLNTQVFHQLLCQLDDAELALSLKPGTLSLSLEEMIDAYMKSFLEPLSIPSEKYFSVRVNEASYKARAARMSHGSSHAAFFDTRLNHEHLIEKRKEEVLEETVDRVFDLELMRLQNSKTFELKHANKLYSEDLRTALRPAMQALVSGEGGFEEIVFDLMYKRQLNDLSVFDKKGSCRLDAMQAYISNLEDYLKADQPSFLFYLFEDKVTYSKKVEWVKLLREWVDDTSLTPNARVQKVQALLKQQYVRDDMQAYSPSFSLAGLQRSMIWFLSCVGLCSFKTEGTMAFESLLRSADMAVSELQVFDALHAEAYRRLDAMLEQIVLLEAHLAPKSDTSYIRPAKLFENKNTRNPKKAKLNELRSIAENTQKTPHQRVEEMREKMANPRFKSDMLTYSTVKDYFKFEAFQRGVIWLLSCVGLYSLPCVAETNKLFHAASSKTVFSDKPLIDVGFFSESVSSTERNYTADIALDKIALVPKT